MRGILKRNLFDINNLSEFIKFVDALNNGYRVDTKLGSREAPQIFY